MRKVDSSSAESVSYLHKLKKKTLNRVWHVALKAAMRNYHISPNLHVVRAIERLNKKAIGAVQMNGSKGEWFRKSV